MIIINRHMIGVSVLVWESVQRPTGRLRTKRLRKRSRAVLLVRGPTDPCNQVTRAPPAATAGGGGGGPGGRGEPGRPRRQRSRQFARACRFACRFWTATRARADADGERGLAADAGASVSRAAAGDKSRVLRYVAGVGRPAGGPGACQGQAKGAGRRRLGPSSIARRKSRVSLLTLAQASGGRFRAECDPHRLGDSDEARPRRAARPSARLSGAEGFGAPR